MKRAFLTAAVLCLSGMAQADEKLVYPIQGIRAIRGVRGRKGRFCRPDGGD